MAILPRHGAFLRSTCSHASNLVAALGLMGLVACVPLGTNREEPKASRSPAPIKTSVTVDVEGPSIVAHTKYENVGRQPILVKKGVWGITAERRGEVFDGAEDEFNVYERKTRQGLVFNGISVYYVKSLAREDFTPIVPGEAVVSSVRIGPLTQGILKGRYLYKFLPGKHEYEVATQYVVLDEGTGRYQSFWTEPAAFTFTLPAGAKQ